MCVWRVWGYCHRPSRRRGCPEPAPSLLPPSTQHPRQQFQSLFSPSASRKTLREDRCPAAPEPWRSPGRPAVPALRLRGRPRRRLRCPQQPAAPARSAPVLCLAPPRSALAAPVLTRASSPPGPRLAAPLRQVWAPGGRARLPCLPRGATECERRAGGRAAPAAGRARPRASRGPPAPPPAPGKPRGRRPPPARPRPAPPPLAARPRQERPVRPRAGGARRRSVTRLPGPLGASPLQLPGGPSPARDPRAATLPTPRTPGARRSLLRELRALAAAVRCLLAKAGCPQGRPRNLELGTRATPRAPGVPPQM